MKKASLLIIILLSLFKTEAQQKPAIRLNLFSSYVFNDAVDSYFDPQRYYRGRINGGFMWGVNTELMIHDDYGLHLTYLRMDTKAPITYLNNFANPKFKEFDLGINYILAGGNRYMEASDKIEFYGGAAGGIAIFSIKNPEPGGQSSLTKFAWNIELGTNIWLAPAVGVKFNTCLLSPVQAFGGGAYFGTGGSGAGITTYSSVFQFGLGGGLVFKIAPHLKTTKK
jgi:hypothetical protein